MQDDDTISLSHFPLKLQDVLAEQPQDLSGDDLDETHCSVIVLFIFLCHKLYINISRMTQKLDWLQVIKRS